MGLEHADPLQVQKAYPGLVTDRLILRWTGDVYGNDLGLYPRNIYFILEVPPARYYDTALDCRGPAGKYRQVLSRQLTEHQR